jgi:hypothetical protein
MPQAFWPDWSSLPNDFEPDRIGKACVTYFELGVRLGVHEIGATCGATVFVHESSGALPRSPASPLRLESWLAVLSVALGAFVFVTSEFLPIGMLTQISARLHVSDGTAGLMVTIPDLVATFAAPLMTIRAGRVDRRILMLGCGNKI